MTVRAGRRRCGLSVVAPLLGRWPSSEHARGRCAPACSSALPPRAPLARTAHHRRSCCVRARRIVPPEASARDVDFLLVSTAYLREPWCACSAMPAHAAPAALGLRVPALLRVCCASPSHACLRWHPHALCLLARAAVTTPTATSRTAAATPDVALALLGVSSLVLLGMLVVSGPPRSSRPVSRPMRRAARRARAGCMLGLRRAAPARCARCVRARSCIVCTACRRASALRCASSALRLPRRVI